MPATSRPISTVHRAVSVLSVLAEDDRDLGTNEIARRSGLNASTTSRLLATLHEDGLVHRSAESGCFALGPRLVELGNAALARIDVRRLARPHLEALTEATGETATLSVPGEETTVTVDFVLSPSSVRSVTEVGRPSVVHATATGKVYLAHRRAIPNAPLPRFTSRTITEADALAQEIALVTSRGWSQAIGEREDDLNAIAAPVEDGAGQLTAVLGLQGPSTRFGRSAMKRAAVELLDHATSLSGRPGR